ncbi:MAG: DUF4440 domain-containing protein [Pyrinomonadaceae bacterium MAG19_C2-C3]|nr:DUF4440 domain-containing protein [Pyrinomonadaceae bacterium MAG19_C2-C3]
MITVFNERDEATKRGDVERVQSFLADDYRIKLPNGRYITRTELLTAKSAVPQILYSEMMTTIEKLKIVGDKAIVHVRESAAFKQPLKDGTMGDFTSSGRRREHWVKTVAGWKLQLTDNLGTDARLTFNGKRVKSITDVPIAHTLPSTPNAEDAARLAAGKALVVIYRLADGAFLINLPVYQDERKVATLGGGNYVKLFLAPGTYILRSDKQPAETIDVGANRIYYFEVKLKPGFPRGRGSLLADGGLIGSQVYKLPQSLKMKKVEIDDSQ